MRSHQTSRFPVSHLQIQDTVSDGCHRLVLSGELDIVTAHELRSVILSLCDGHISMLTLDFRKLTFLDSTGVTAVLFARDLCHERDCAFGVIAGPAHVQLPFELCGPFPNLRFISPSEVDRTSLSRSRAPQQRSERSAANSAFAQRVSRVSQPSTLGI
jgi:anti-anti-sigma factor